MDPESLLRAIPDGLWMSDDDGRTTYANDRMAEMLGLTREQMLAYTAFDGLDEQGARDFRAHIDERNASGLPGHDLECRLKRADGSVVWALISHTPVLGADGVRTGWLHRVKDYTVERRTQAELEHREARFAEAEAIARLGSWERTLDDGDEVTWSAESYRLCGVDPDTFVPALSTFVPLLNADDVERLMVDYLRMLEDGSSLDVEARLAKLDDAGRPSWLRIRGVLVRDRDGDRIQGTLQDITRLKSQAQGLALLSALSSAANRCGSLGELLEHFDRHVRPHSQWAGILAALPEHAGRTGRRHVVRGRDDELGHVLRLVDIARPAVEAAVRDCAVALVDRAARTGELVHDLGPHGRRLVAGPTHRAGELAGVVVVDTGTAAEPEAADLAVFLQALGVIAQVAEREAARAALASARDDALEASRAKSDFLATMSHEIRTPLNGVIGLSELLRGTDLTEYQQRLTGGVVQAGRTLLGLVDDILDLSKIEAGRLDLEEVEFDPGLVLEQCARLAADSARERGLELVVSVDGDLPGTVCGDPVRFGQVVTNLASNAVKFTTQGEVVVRALRGGSGVRVEVRDTGVGIARETQERLFDAFVQADVSTTRRFGGTGLGLAICRRIVRAMGGEIGVHSEAGAGSTFWFEVPLVEPPLPAGRADPAVERTRQLAELGVLVVADHAGARHLLGDQLRAWGARVAEAAPGPETVRELRAARRRGRPLDVVLLDASASPEDGVQLARTIRADDEHGTPRLVLAAPAPDLDPGLLADRDLDALLAKPVLPSELLDTVLSVISARERATPEPPTPHDAPPPGPRGRVLVVEDNPINQLVAEGMVARLGYTVVLAANGAAAVNAVVREEAGFDAIVMDCQMPVMDGYAATREIRALEGAGRRVPIIALTAAAVAEERERCLAAGMDDFLTKPIDLRLLEVALARRVPGGPSSASVPSATDAGEGPPAAAEPVEDQQASLRRRAAELDTVDATLVTTLHARWLERIGRSLVALDDAVDLGSAPDVVRVVHALGGVASNIGLSEVAAACADLEQAGRHGDLPSPAAREQLRDALDRSAHDVTTYTRERAAQA